MDVETNTNFNNEGEYEISVTCGDVCEKETNPISCGIPIEDGDTRTGSRNEISYYCGCEDVNGNEIPDGLNWGPEDAYEFVINNEQEITLTLDILQPNRDLELYLIRRIGDDDKECVFKSRNPRNAQQEVINEVLAAGAYIVIVEGHRLSLIHI